MKPLFKENKNLKRKSSINISDESKIKKYNLLSARDFMSTDSIIITLPNSQKKLIKKIRIDPVGIRIISIQNYIKKINNEVKHTLNMNTLAPRILKNLRLESLSEKNNVRSQNEITKAEYNFISVLRTCLWVDKYAPNNFIDLLTDESSNRMLLRWLKLWDHIAFNKPLPPKLNTDKPNPSSTYDIEKTIVLDVNKRPCHKTVMVYGTSGIGKSSMVRVIVKQCGYSVIEINCSNELSISEFNNTINNATELNNYLNKSYLPICLILDEIDAASKHVINSTISRLTNSNKNKRLKRPIICICNNPFTPALKKLRAISLLINIPSIPTYKMMQRISYILKNENIEYEDGALNVICERFSGDMRQCLNTLQFIVSEDSNIKLIDLHNTKSSFSSSAYYFESISHVLRRCKLQDFSFESSSKFEHFVKFSQSVLNFDRFINGLFENYNTNTNNRLTVNDIFDCLNYFEFTSFCAKFVDIHKNYQLQHYCHFLPVLINMLCSNQRKISVRLPQPFYEASSGFSKKIPPHSFILQNFKNYGYRAFANISQSNSSNKKKIDANFTKKIVATAQQLYTMRDLIHLDSLIKWDSSFVLVVECYRIPLQLNFRCTSKPIELMAVEKKQFKTTMINNMSLVEL
ncbi:hypothetical protein HZS_3777, partial [Henneguya salminicola]